MAASPFTTTATAAPASRSPGAARVKFWSQFRLGSARVPRVGFGIAPKQFFPNQLLHETGRVLGEKPANGKFANPRTASPAREDACATLRQRNALKGADDVVGSFLGEKAFVIARAEVPVRAFVIVVAIKSPGAADHDDAAHPVVPIIADVVET